MPQITAIYGSPRKHGNTAALLAQAVEGARQAGAQVTEFWLRDMKISPCLEIYGCRKAGRCVIKDDFQGLFDSVMASDGLMLASPIFFYTVSAHTKIMMDRFQSLWVKRYWIEKAPFRGRPCTKKAMFISVGATGGKRLFEGALLTMRYFLDPLDMELWRALTYRNLDHAGEAQGHPEYLSECLEGGRALAQALA